MQSAARGRDQTEKVFLFSTHATLCYRDISYMDVYQDQLILVSVHEK